MLLSEGKKMPLLRAILKIFWFAGLDRDANFRYGFRTSMWRRFGGSVDSTPECRRLMAKLQVGIIVMQLPEASVDN